MMSSTYQQSLANAGSETRPPMLERDSYVSWASRFLRYIERKRETWKFLRHSIDVGPYEMKLLLATTNIAERKQTEDDLIGDDLKQYEAYIEAMNLNLISIPNDIYNSMDACKNEKEMWDKVKRFM
ncbi:hypothetical protein Tco_1182680 [Tanacetum coccineum]